MKTTTCIAVLCMSAVACTKDLRPSVMSEREPGTDEQRAGRDLIAKMARAHGAERIGEYETLTVHGTDTWTGIAKMFFNPWPESPAHFVADMRLGSFDARARFSSEDEEVHGLTWGLQSWSPYLYREGGAVEFIEDEDISFILPALQYLTELPFRAISIPLVSDLGGKAINGKTYRRVFATWKSFSPNDTDQYVLYLDPKTHRLEKVEYTVRAWGAFLSGAMHYEDYRDVDGVWVPFQQSVTAGVEDDPDDFGHRIVLERAEFDAVDAQALLPNPGLPRVGNKKNPESS